MPFIPKSGPYAGQEFASERQHRNQVAYDQGFRGERGGVAGAVDAKIEFHKSEAARELREKVAERLPEKEIIPRAASHMEIADYAARYDAQDAFIRDYDRALDAEMPNIWEFNRLFAAAEPYMTKETYDAIKTDGADYLRGIPEFMEYLEYLGIEPEDYEIWYH